MQFLKTIWFRFCRFFAQKTGLIEPPLSFHEYARRELKKRNLRDYSGGLTFAQANAKYG